MATTKKTGTERKAAPKKGAERKREDFDHAPKLLTGAKRDRALADLESAVKAAEKAFMRHPAVKAASIDGGRGNEFHFIVAATHNGVGATMAAIRSALMPAAHIAGSVVKGVVEESVKAGIPKQDVLRRILGDTMGSGVIVGIGGLGDLLSALANRTVDESMAADGKPEGKPAAKPAKKTAKGKRS